MLAGGAINAFLAVGLGAFGAHALKTRLDADLLAIWHTAVQYHFGHALALVLTGLTLAVLPHASLLKWSGWLFLAGIILFSGSLYLLSLSGQRWLGAVTPFGGLAFLAGWVVYAVAVLRAA